MGMLEGRVAALDIGGTYIKHAIFENGRLLAGSCGQFAVRADGETEEFLRSLTKYLGATGAKQTVIAMPGPTDFTTGTSRMQHKLPALFNVSLKAELEARLPGLKSVFLHDAVAFMAGVMALHETENAQCPCGIMLGTGLGFAMAREGRIVLNDQRTPVPPLWNEPCKGSIAEDHLSARAVVGYYRDRGGLSTRVREIAQRAAAGDAAALLAFEQAGRILGELVQIRARTLGIDLCILGGQISKAADFMLPAAHEMTDIQIKPTAHPDDAALYGACAWVNNGHCSRGEQ